MNFCLRSSTEQEKTTLQFFLAGLPFILEKKNVHKKQVFSLIFHWSMRHTVFGPILWYLFLHNSVQQHPYHGGKSKQRPLQPFVQFTLSQLFKLNNFSLLIGFITTVTQFLIEIHKLLFSTKLINSLGCSLHTGSTVKYSMCQNETFKLTVTFNFKTYR